MKKLLCYDVTYGRPKRTIAGVYARDVVHAAETVWQLLKFNGKRPPTRYFVQLTDQLELAKASVRDAHDGPPWPTGCTVVMHSRHAKRAVLSDARRAVLSDALQRSSELWSGEASSVSIC